MLILMTSILFGAVLGAMFGWKAVAGIWLLPVGVCIFGFFKGLLGYGKRR